MPRHPLTYSKIQLIFPIAKEITKSNSSINSSRNFSSNKIFSVGISTLLVISESLPFFDNIKSNGILDILKNINHK